MYRINVVVINAYNVAEGRPVGPEFDKPADVIKYVGELDRTGLKHLEINQYDPDGQLVESVSFEDFARHQKDLEFTEMLQTFDKCMADFQALAQKTLETLEEISNGAVTRIAESTERAIATIKEISDPTTSSDLIAKEYFEQGAHNSNKTMPDPSFHEWNVPLTEEQAQRLFAIHVAGNPDKKPVGSFLAYDARLVTWKIVGTTELYIVFRRSTQLELKTGKEIIETDLRRSGALWLEQDEE